MSELSERDASRLRDMLENARLAQQFMAGRTKEDLHYDNINYDILWNVVHEKLEPLIETLLPPLRAFYPNMDL